MDNRPIETLKKIHCYKMVCVHLSQTILRAIVPIDVYVLDSLYQKKRTTKTVQYFMQFNLLLLFSS